MNDFESSVINLIWTKKLVLLYWCTATVSNLALCTLYNQNPEHTSRYQNTRLTEARRSKLHATSLRIQQLQFQHGG